MMDPQAAFYFTLIIAGGLFVGVALVVPHLSAKRPAPPPAKAQEALELARSVARDLARLRTEMIPQVAVQAAGLEELQETVQHVLNVTDDIDDSIERIALRLKYDLFDEKLADAQRGQG